MVETEGKVGVRKRKITEERVIRGKGGTVRKGERSQEGGKKGTKGKRRGMTTTGKGTANLRGYIILWFPRGFQRMGISDGDGDA